MDVVFDPNMRSSAMKLVFKIQCPLETLRSSTVNVWGLGSDQNA